MKEHLDDSVNYSSLKCLLVNEVLKKMTELNHDSVIKVGIFLSFVFVVKITESTDFFIELS